MKSIYNYFRNSRRTERFIVGRFVSLAPFPQNNMYIYLCLVFHLLCVFIYIARRFFFRAISNGIDDPGEIHLPLCSFAFIRKSSLLVAIASF